MEMLSQSTVDALLKGPNRDFSHLITAEETTRILKNLLQQKHASKIFRNLLAQVKNILENNGDNHHEVHMLALDFLYHAGRSEIGDFHDNELWKPNKEKGLEKYVKTILEKHTDKTPQKYISLARNFHDRRTVDWQTAWMDEEMLARFNAAPGIAFNSNISKWGNAPFIIVPKITTVYKIMNPEGKFSTGGRHVYFNNVGKTWSSKKNLKSHFRLVLEGRNVNAVNTRYKDCVIVAYETNTYELTERPTVVDWIKEEMK